MDRRGAPWAPTAPGSSTRSPPAARSAPPPSPPKPAWTSTLCCVAWVCWPAPASSSAATAAGASVKPDRPGWHPCSGRATLGCIARPGGTGDHRTGRGSSGRLRPPAGLACRPRARDRHAQDRLRRRSAGSGRAGRTRGSDAHRPDLCRTGHGHRRHSRRPGSGLATPASPTPGHTPPPPARAPPPRPARPPVSRQAVKWGLAATGAMIPPAMFVTAGFGAWVSLALLAMPLLFIELIVVLLYVTITLARQRADRSSASGGQVRPPPQHDRAAL